MSYLGESARGDERSQVEIYTELEAMEKEIKWGRKLEMVNE